MTSRAGPTARSKTRCMVPASRTATLGAARAMMRRASGSTELGIQARAPCAARGSARRGTRRAGRPGSSGRADACSASALLGHVAHHPDDAVAAAHAADELADRLAVRGRTSCTNVSLTTTSRSAGVRPRAAPPALSVRPWRSGMPMALEISGRDQPEVGGRPRVRGSAGDDEARRVAPPRNGGAGWRRRRSRPGSWRARARGRAGSRASRPGSRSPASRCRRPRRAGSSTPGQIA